LGIIEASERGWTDVLVLGVFGMFFLMTQ